MLRPTDWWSKIIKPFLAKRIAVLGFMLGIFITIIVSNWINSSNRNELLSTIQYYQETIDELNRSILNTMFPTGLTKRAELMGAVVHSFEQAQNLITKEVDMSSAINIDNSWGSWGVFNSVDEITYYATGLFTTDVASISERDIILDEIGEILHVIIERPVIHSIVLRLEETQFESDRGFFRGGTLSLEPEEQNALQMQIEQTFRLIMLEELMETAHEYTISSVINLLTVLLSGLDLHNYEVNVLWR
ncbi:MAG: DUF4230 domain-containing protein [Defluviitaleaceae bacterium]|nr:DUF4230 domain-containing protein [Defluviitaleaceae bacterium]